MSNATPSEQTDSPSPSLLDQIDSTCDRFEAAWHTGQPPEIADFLANLSHTPSASKTALIELIKIDLECRWRRPADSTAGTESRAANTHSANEVRLPPRPLLEDYVRAYPALGPLEEVPEAHPQRICISTSGVRTDPPWLDGLLARGYDIFCGFDADNPGDAAQGLSVYEAALDLCHRLRIEVPLPPR